MRSIPGPWWGVDTRRFRPVRVVRIRGITLALERADKQAVQKGEAYGARDSNDYESVRGGGREPPHHLQLDFGWQGGIRADGWRIDPHLRRFVVAFIGPRRAGHAIRSGSVGGIARVISIPGSHSGGPEAGRPANGPALDADLRILFHRLNNQLGIILAHAELLEAKSADDLNRARAAQLVSSALDAMGTAKSIRQLTEPGLAGS
jgi:hypothetical protein